jgi:predicted transcriptional regulator
MPTMKEIALNLIKNLPDNCTFEDIQYELYAKEKIEKGLKDIDEGNVLTEEEMDAEIQSWQA